MWVYTHRTVVNTFIFIDVARILWMYILSVKTRKQDEYESIDFHILVFSFTLLNMGTQYNKNTKNKKTMTLKCLLMLTSSTYLCTIYDCISTKILSYTKIEQCFTFPDISITFYLLPYFSTTFFFLLLILWIKRS